MMQAPVELSQSTREKNIHNRDSRVCGQAIKLAQHAISSGMVFLPKEGIIPTHQSFPFAESLLRCLLHESHISSPEDTPRVVSGGYLKFINTLQALAPGQPILLEKEGGEAAVKYWNSLESW